MKLTYPKHEHVSMNELIKNNTEPIAHVHYLIKSRWLLINPLMSQPLSNE